jgi:hypothetical protein
VVALVLEVKAPTLREAVRRAAAIGAELTEGRSVQAPASDLWIRSWRINHEATGGINERHHATA